MRPGESSSSAPRHRPPAPPPPPPPPRPPHHGITPRAFPPVTIAPMAAVWLPRGPPLTARFPLPRQLCAFVRPSPPPPWAMPPRPAVPHSFSMRPAIHSAVLHRPPPPSLPRSPRGFGRQARLQVRPRVDPDTQWLAEFVQEHLDSDGASRGDTIDDREPPLRQIRVRLAEMLTKISELETRGKELVELEKILRATSREDELVLARVKAQAERTRKECEVLRATLEELQNPTPFGMGPETHRDALAFTKRIQKKKAYRLRRHQKLRAERTIRDKLQEQEPPDRNASASHEKVDTTAEEAVPTEPDGTDNSTVARRDRRRECEAARKVLLALELREARQGTELTAAERQEIQEARALATVCLRRKRKRKRRRALRSDETQTSQQPSGDTVASLSTTRRSLVMPLRDPYAVDMKTLISVRRQWDVYFVPQRANGASAIPPHFVIPPDKPSAQWAPFAMQSHADNQDL